MSLTIAIALFVTVAMIAVFWDNRPRSKYKGDEFTVDHNDALSSGENKNGGMA